MAHTGSQEGNHNCSIQDTGPGSDRASSYNRQLNAIRATESAYALRKVDGIPSQVATYNMATPANINYGETRRNLSSPRPRGRENQKNIPCRNITIYGNCRYENEGCAFNHDRSSFGGLAPASTNSSSVQLAVPQIQETSSAYINYRSMRTRMNADSPSFTPAQTTQNGGQNTRSTTISPKAANAAVFTPKTNKSSKKSLWKLVVMRNFAANFRIGPLAQTLQTREPQEFKPQEFKNEELKTQELKAQDFNAEEFKPQEFKPQEFKPQEFKPQEFKPRNQNEAQQQAQQPITSTSDFSQQSYDQTQMYNQPDASAVANIMASYDPFTNAAMQGMSHSQQQSQLNPYAQDLSGMGGPSNFFNAATDFQQPVSSSLVSFHIPPIQQFPEPLKWKERTRFRNWIKPQKRTLNPEASAFVPLRSGPRKQALNALIDPAAQQYSLQRQFSTAPTPRMNSSNDSLPVAPRVASMNYKESHRQARARWWASKRAPTATTTPEQMYHIRRKKKSRTPAASPRDYREHQTSLKQTGSQRTRFGPSNAIPLRAVPMGKSLPMPKMVSLTEKFAKIGLDSLIMSPGVPDASATNQSTDERVILTPMQIQYHLYAPLGTDRTRLEGYQRLVHNLFMPDDLREDLQKKAEATLRVLPTSNLPPAIAHFHTLYPLDTSQTKNATIYGYPTSIYKAKSSQDGRYYALRRVEGFRLEREEAIRSVQKWKTVRSAGLVSIQEAFTTRDFGDSSLILITDYHPNSKALQEVHFSMSNRSGGSSRSQSASYVGEHILWSYIVQIAHALKAIHSAGLAARVITPSKILLTSKNRIRLNGCAITDIVKYDSLKPVVEAQQDDFVAFGKLILAVASPNANAQQNMEKALQNLTRSTYSTSLKQTISWLLNPPAQIPSPFSPQVIGNSSGTSSQPAYTKDVDTLLRDISDQSTRVLESSLSENDQLHSTLMSELENGRIVRLMAKLGVINERPEFEHNPQWSETGERYYLKLFRDYVFHQVDAQGNPVVDLAWIISCLNKLDAGSEEKIQLVSRDEQIVFVVSYREIKKGVESGFNELLRAGRR